MRISLDNFFTWTFSLGSLFFRSCIFCNWRVWFTYNNILRCHIFSSKTCILWWWTRLLKNVYRFIILCISFLSIVKHSCSSKYILWSKHIQTIIHFSLWFIFDCQWGHIAIRRLFCLWFLEPNDCFWLLFQSSIW